MLIKQYIFYFITFIFCYIQSFRQVFVYRAVFFVDILEGKIQKGFVGCEDNSYALLCIRTEVFSQIGKMADVNIIVGCNVVLLYGFHRYA